MTAYGSYPQQPGYGTPQGYAPPYGYAGPRPRRPGAVTTAAVLGFILGAFAVIGAIFSFVGTSFLVGVDDGGTGIASALTGVLVVIGLLVLIIAVVLIWGSLLAVTGRSRVLLIVGASVLTALGLIGVLGSLGNSGTSAGGLVFQLVGLVMAILIIVLLSLGASGQYFAAQRALRGR